jgi:hypothetical protein
MGNLGDDITGIMRVIKYMNKTEKMVNDDIHKKLDYILSDTN